MPGEVERTGERRTPPASVRPARRAAWDTQPRQRRGQAHRHALGAALLEARDHLGDPQRGAGVDVEGGEAHDARPAREERRPRATSSGAPRGQARPRTRASAIPGRRWRVGQRREACRRGHRRSRPARRPAGRVGGRRCRAGEIAPSAQSGRPVRLAAETRRARGEPGAGAEEPHRVRDGRRVSPSAVVRVSSARRPAPASERRVRGARWIAPSPSSKTIVRTVASRGGHVSRRMDSR